MSSKSGNVTLYIDEDQDGNALPFEIPVLIEYVTITDKNYGADADGNRGVELIETEVTDITIAQHKEALTPEQVEWVTENARTMFLEGGRY